MTVLSVKMNVRSGHLLISKSAMPEGMEVVIQLLMGSSFVDLGELASATVLDDEAFELLDPLYDRMSVSRKIFEDCLSVLLNDFDGVMDSGDRARIAGAYLESGYKVNYDVNRHLWIPLGGCDYQFVLVP